MAEAASLAIASVCQAGPPLSLNLECQPQSVPKGTDKLPNKIEIPKLRHFGVDLEDYKIPTGGKAGGNRFGI